MGRSIQLAPDWGSAKSRPWFMTREGVNSRTFPLKDPFDSHVPVRARHRWTDLRQDRVRAASEPLRVLQRDRLPLRKYRRELRHECFPPVFLQSCLRSILLLKGLCHVNG